MAAAQLSVHAPPGDPMLTPPQVDCKVAAFAEVVGLKEKLPAMVNVLDSCQRALSDFLEEKRSLFPRFYFLGDDDLLEILGQARNPQVIQAHLKKLFAGIHKVPPPLLRLLRAQLPSHLTSPLVQVHFNQDQSSIVKMCSIEGEMVRLSSPVQVTEAIEVWLAQLSVAMKQTLTAELGAISRDASSAESSQILCLLEAVQFTARYVGLVLHSCPGADTILGARVEGAIEHSSLQSLRSAVVKRLEEVVGGDYSGQSLLKLRQQALVIDFIHYRDVVELLIAQRTASKADWNWTRQLRYYHKQVQACRPRGCTGGHAFVRWRMCSRLADNNGDVRTNQSSRAPLTRRAGCCAGRGGGGADG
jgi:dynein heavy chain 2, cytosolic